MENIVSSLGPSLGHHGNAESDYNEIYHKELQPHHKASLTHEAIAGAAGFAAMRAYESHVRASGKEPSHALMKEILAGIAAAEVEKLVETKGLDMIDRHKAKKIAAERAQQLAQQRYQGGVGWEHAQAQGVPAMEYNYGGGLPWGMQGHPAYGGVPVYPPGAYAGGYPAQGGYYYPPPPASITPQYYPPPAAHGLEALVDERHHDHCHHGHLRRHCRLAH